MVSPVESKKVELMERESSGGYKRLKRRGQVQNRVSLGQEEQFCDLPRSTVTPVNNVHFKVANEVDFKSHHKKSENDRK